MPSPSRRGGAQRSHQSVEESTTEQGTQAAADTGNGEAAAGAGEQPATGAEQPASASGDQGASGDPPAAPAAGDSPAAMPTDPGAGDPLPPAVPAVDPAASSSPSPKYKVAAGHSITSPRGILDQGAEFRVTDCTAEDLERLLLQGAIVRG